MNGAKIEFKPESVRKLCGNLHDADQRWGLLIGILYAYSGPA